MAVDVEDRMSKVYRRLVVDVVSTMMWLVAVDRRGNKLPFGGRLCYCRSSGGTDEVGKQVGVGRRVADRGDI